jgi:hypothetical protein
MELNIQMSINIDQNKTRKQKSYPEPDDGTQSGTFSFNCN